jgi:hypothetical protein
VAMAAPGSVTARTVNVGQTLNIEAQRVNASVQATGSGDVGGSVTGFGGGMASDVQLTLSSPYAFRFSNLFSSTGNVNVPSGDLFIDALWVSNRMTLSNPMTRVLVDQVDQSIQPFDVQLYSAGEPFAFSFTRNRVSTDALTIYRSPNHEVLSPSGNNMSAAEAAAREQALLGTLPPAYVGANMGSQPPATPGSVVSFVGTPVRTDEECKTGAGEGSGASSNPNCKEEDQ